MGGSQRIFLSAATTEFGVFRSELATALRGQYLEVDDQPTFANAPEDALRKFARKIRHDQLVIHIVGNNPGSPAPEIPVNDLFDVRNDDHIKIDSFLSKFVSLSRDDLKGITYTQWEALIAVYYNIPLLVYAPSSAKGPGNEIAASFPQKRHLDRLANEVVDIRFKPNFFDNIQYFGMHLMRDITAHLFRPPPAPQSRHPKPLFSEFFEAESFIGRDNELTQVSGLIRKHRVVNLVGPGGSGKTWFANEVLYRLQEEFSDGSWVVELAGVEEPDEIESAVGLALKIGEKDGKLSLAEHFADRQALLVLDNCERLREGCVALIKSLAGCAKLRIITTSTIDLGLGHAKTYHVSPLQLPAKGESRKAEVEKADAVKLLLAHADSRGLRLTDENAAYVAEICRMVEGMPLALKMVAARCDSSSVSQLKEVIASMQDIMDDAPYSDNCPRHKTVAAVVEWSYNLLPHDLEEMLLGLSIFRDGFSAAAARDVCGGSAATPSKVKGILRQLTDHSMVESRDIPEDEDKSGRRFRILEPIRLFCAGKLKADPKKIESLAEKHRDWCVQFLRERAKIMERGGEKQTAIARQIFVEHDNIRAAMNWCRDRHDSANGLRLATDIWRFWEVHGFHMEGRREIEALLEANPPGANEKLVALAHTAAGMLAYRQGKYQEAGAAFDTALSMEKGLAEKDRLRLCMCQTDVANVLSRTGRREESLRLHRETLAEAESIGDPRQLAISRCNCAAIPLGLGRLDDADEIEDLLKKSEDGFRRANCDTDVGYPMTLRGWLAFYQGNYEKAATAFQNAYDNRVHIKSKPGMFLALEGAVWSLLSHGDVDGARAKLQECFALRLGLHSDIANAQVLECAALFALRTGHPGDSLTYLASAARLREAAGSLLPLLSRAVLKKWEAEARQSLSDDDASSAFNKGTYENVEELLRCAQAMVKA